MRPCCAVFLGRVDYAEALQLQLAVCAAKRSGFQDDVLLLLEHPPTVTLGRNGSWDHLLVSERVLADRGVVRFETDRGGDITFHGPGQLVGYPLLELVGRERDVHRFMRKTEEVLLRVVARYGIAAHRQEHLTGVWTAQGKIAALGVHISRWITRHGFALNVNTDLSFFDLIVPCGLAGRSVTSMAACSGRTLELAEVGRELAETFATVFERALCWMQQDELRGRLERHARASAVA